MQTYWDSIFGLKPRSFGLSFPTFVWSARNPHALVTGWNKWEGHLRQLMAGSRKFAIEHLGREVPAAITPGVFEISCIPYIMDPDKEETEKIFDG